MRIRERADRPRCGVVSNQAIFYSQAAPLNPRKHADWRLQSRSGYEFSRNANCVPVMAVEFLKAGRENPVVFLEQNGIILPVGLLGLRQGENLCLTEEGGWTGDYVPAYIRRYPFIFAASEDGATFTLCIDEDYAGFNQNGVGDTLFEENGQPSPYLEKVLTFLKEYELQYRRTQEFCRIVKGLDLLEPMQARFTLANGEKVGLTGFLSISREKLKNISPEKLVESVSKGVLELIYCHLFSLENFTQLVKRINADPSSTPGTD